MEHNKVLTLPEAFTLGVRNRCDGLPMLAHAEIPNGTPQVDAYFMGYLGADLRIGDGAVVRSHRLTADEVQAYVEEKQFLGLLPHPNAYGIRPAPACETLAPVSTDEPARIARGSGPHDLRESLSEGLQGAVMSRTARPVKYTATFSDGQEIKRASVRVYTHAWRLTWNDAQGPHYAAGFAGSRELAREASASWERGVIKNAGATGCVVEIVAVQS